MIHDFRFRIIESFSLKNSELAQLRIPTTLTSTTTAVFFVNSNTVEFLNRTLFLNLVFILQTAFKKQTQLENNFLI